MNENAKRGWKVYCSNKCIGLFNRSRKEFICFREGCGMKFLRTPSDSVKSKHFYCSLKCAAIVNNQLYPRSHGAIVKICGYCKKEFIGNKKYCSRKCKDLDAVIPESILLDSIKSFVKKNKRIPYKKELSHYHAIRARFGTWNKAIKISGFSPNPVMFAKKYIALDGRKCDSLSEKIIDDYLFRRNIKHERNFPYPGDKGFTVDFRIGNYWIEFFGLKGYKKYDSLARRKMNLVKKYNLKFLSIYPRDLFPKGRLQEVLASI